MPSHIWTFYSIFCWHNSFSPASFSFTKILSIFIYDLLFTILHAWDKCLRRIVTRPQAVGDLTEHKEKTRVVRVSTSCKLCTHFFVRCQPISLSLCLCRWRLKKRDQTLLLDFSSQKCLLQPNSHLSECLYVFCSFLFHFSNTKRESTWIESFRRRIESIIASSWAVCMSELFITTTNNNVKPL